MDYVLCLPGIFVILECTIIYTVSLLYDGRLESSSVHLVFYWHFASLVQVQWLTYNTEICVNTLKILKMCPHLKIIHVSFSFWTLLISVRTIREILWHRVLFQIFSYLGTSESCQMTWTWAFLSLRPHFLASFLTLPGVCIKKVISTTAVSFLNILHQVRFLYTILHCFWSLLYADLVCHLHLTIIYLRLF